jgi:DNA polymerase-3 subunit delta'
MSAEETSRITPITNPMLFGHEEALAELWQQHQQGKLAHGWLFSGPQGIGKATLAYKFARAILAEEGSTDIADVHPVFKRIASHAHTDFRVVEPEYDEKKGEFAREISVDQAREIAEFLSLTPGEGNWRVVIIDSIDQLNVNAANAILKILEEPPGQALLILISHNPGKLLPTIRSRCRQLRLSPLEQKTFARVLRNVAPEVDSGQMTALAELSELSPGVAIELYERGAVDMYRTLMELLSDLPELPHKKLHSFADQIGTGAVHSQWALFSRLMLTLIARVAKHASGVPMQEISDGERAILEKMAALHAPSLWAERWQQTQAQFLLAAGRHLDYKQVIISYFHSLASKEGLRIGSAA